MLVYRQSTGAILRPTGERIGVGYSGHGAGLNNGALEAMPNIGPIPCGSYAIGPPQDGGHLGPYVLPLTPDLATFTHGRDGFYIHGDSVEHAGEQQASHGCIVLGRDIREAIWQSGDHRLQVIP